MHIQKGALQNSAEKNKATSRPKRGWLVAYLSPMLLRIPDPRCAQLAQTLREKWGALWPKDSYDVADFEKIVGGFRHSVMGIDLAGKHIGKSYDE